MDKLNAFIEHLEADEDREAAANEAYQQELFKKYVLRGGRTEPGQRTPLEAVPGRGRADRPKGAAEGSWLPLTWNISGRAICPITLSNPSPAFHKELDEVWINGVMKGMNPLEQAKRISRMEGCRERRYQAPRGHAKTTTFTFKDSLHASLYGYKHYSSCCRTAPSRRKDFWQGSRTRSRKMVQSGKILETRREKSGSPQSFYLTTGRRSKPLDPVKKSVDGSINSGGRT